MGRACSTHGINEKCIQNRWSENMKGTDHSEGKWKGNITMALREIGWETWTVCI